MAQALAPEPQAPRATIIICTLADYQRGAALLRAIDSLLHGNRERPRVHVAVNGQRYDPALLDELKARTDIFVTTLPKPSRSNALVEARKLVDTEFFGFLDDDDEYLPGALDMRIQAFSQSGDPVDIVVTNGLRNAQGRETTALGDLSDVAADPAGAMLRSNWLASCGALFRTATVALDCFDEFPEYLEWTWLGYKLALEGKRVATVAAPTFRINDTPNSVSKSSAYLLAHVDITQRMLDITTREDLRVALQKRLTDAHHALAEYHLEQGNKSSAFTHHLRSMGSLYGLRYLLFTRKLLRIRA